MESKWIISYVLNSDEKSLSTLQLLANSDFNEVGRFTSEEAKNVIKLIHKEPVPDFSKSLEDWDEFNKKLKTKIFNLYKK